MARNRKIIFKNGVRINGHHFQEHIAVMVQFALETAPPTTDDAVWITSANDSKHKTGSKHYTNEAFDIRIFNVVDGAVNISKWVTAFRNRLNRYKANSYDVVLESDHIHVEYDPK